MRPDDPRAHLARDWVTRAQRDLADVPDEILNRLQPVFYTDPINAAIRAMGLE